MPSWSAGYHGGFSLQCTGKDGEGSSLCWKGSSCRNFTSVTQVCATSARHLFLTGTGGGCTHRLMC